jgi:multidrug resistance efflux pump
VLALLLRTGRRVAMQSRVESAGGDSTQPAMAGRLPDGQPQERKSAMDKSQQHATTSHRTQRRRRVVNPLQQAITLSSFLRFEFFGLLLLVIAGGLIFFFWHQDYYYYTTDHAFVTGNVANIMPNRTGTITNIYYRVGDNVRAGDKIAVLQTNNGSSFDAISPISGQIVSEGSIPTILVGLGQQLGVGQVLQADQNIAQVVDTNSIQIIAVVDSSHAKDVKVGQDVDVQVPSVTDNTLHGVVNTILPVSADWAAGNPNPAYQPYLQKYQGVPIEIYLAAAGAYTFQPGAQAIVTIHTHEDESSFLPTVVVGPTATPSPEPSH